MNIAICDDEEWARKQIIGLLHQVEQDLGEEFAIYETSSGEELLNLTIEYQILLLDIEMPDMDGIKTGQQLRDRGNDCRIIMLTGAVERFKEAFNISAYRFVTKPVDYNELKSAIHSAVKSFVGYVSYEVMAGLEHVQIMLKDIYYIKSAGNYLEIITKKKKYTKNTTMRRQADFLQKNGFTEVSRGLMVNLQYICSLKKYEAVLKNGDVLSVSFRRFKEVMQEYIDYDLHMRG